MEFSHIPVLLNEAVNSLSVTPGGIYVDGTVGGAGHSFQIASRLAGSGHLYCFDKDPDAIEAAADRLKGFSNVTLIHADFHEMKQELEKRHLSSVDGVLLDLGVSSHQIDTGERGFSYHQDAPLDMRMSQVGISAYDIVNNWEESALVEIFFRFGEEKYARKIAKGIILSREKAPVVTTMQLMEIIRQSVPAQARRGKNPGRKTFQALRIAVNQELEGLEPSLLEAFSLLKIGGHLSVISFHSLEDRVVKKTFASLSLGCTCPPDFPVCVCHKTPSGQCVPKKPISPSEKEILANRRSRSAKLRVIQKIKEQERQRT